LFKRHRSQLGHQFGWFMMKLSNPLINRTAYALRALTARYRTC
jgi:hypothetical protein